MNLFKEITKIEEFVHIFRRISMIYTKNLISSQKLLFGRLYILYFWVLTI
jgi:hypothetical protein